MSIANNPLVEPPPSEVPLPDSPLIRVVAQIRFPLITSVEKQEFIAPFQEAIRKVYPVLRAEQSRSVVLGPQGVTETRSSIIWRFLDKSSTWRVSLAPEFLALETERYSSRNDFLQRLGVLMSALKEHVDPQVIDRLGIRYIDRITGENLSRLPDLVRPEVAGILGASLMDHVHHTISESVFTLPAGAGQVTTKWGLLPPNGTVDPAAVESIDEASWLLDIDAFQASTRELDIDAVLEQAKLLSERIYSVFRWVVTDEFLRCFGGQP
jgi:uncharacterized protein (TIGR04255 family)